MQHHTVYIPFFLAELWQFNNFHHGYNSCKKIHADEANQSISLNLGLQLRTVDKLQRQSPLMRLHLLMRKLYKPDL